VSDEKYNTLFSLNIFRSYQFIIHFFLMYIHTYIYTKKNYFA
jgi:hypothetical protein